MGPVVLLFAARDTDIKSNGFGEGRVSSSEIMAMLGQPGGTAGVWVGWGPKVAQEALEPPPWEVVNNRGGGCCCW